VRKDSICERVLTLEGLPSGVYHPDEWQRAENRVYKALIRAFRRRGRVSRHSALKQIRQRLAEFGDCLEAANGALLLPVSRGSALRAVASFNVPEGLTIRLSERSIVGYVWEHSESYCTGDALLDSYYRHEVDGIRSAISAPVMEVDDTGGHRLAVLHYESYERNAFSPADRRDLEAFALEMAPLVRISNDRGSVFNPYWDGWDLDKAVEWALNVAADSWCGRGGVRLMLTLWYVDRAKRQAWVVAATGFGKQMGQILDQDCYLTREVASQPPLSTIWARPECYVVQRRKAERMGIRETAFVPLPNPRDDSAPPEWILGFHCPRTVPGDCRPGEPFLRWLAQQLAFWLTGLTEQRRQLARPYLRQVISRVSARPEGGLAPATEALRLVFNADQASLFGFPCGGKRLHALATTSALYVAHGPQPTDVRGVLANSHRHQVKEKQRESSCVKWS
jgi:hypothetical protein